MASIQACESVSAPQLPTGNTPHVQQQGATAPTPAPPHNHSACAPSRRALTQTSKPPWLRSFQSKPNRPAPSSVSAIYRCPTSRTDPVRPCALKTAQPPLHDASSSVPATAAPVGSRPPVERAGKRKAAEEAPPRDLEPCRASAGARSREAKFIGVDEGLKIMKNQGRRVTITGGEAYDAGHPGCARAAGPAPSDDNHDRDTLLTWRRKICGPLAASSSVSGIKDKDKDVGATSAASGVPRTPRATAAANSNGPGPNIINQEVPSGGEMADEMQPATNAQPMEWAAASSWVEWTTGSARPAMDEVSAPSPAEPLPEEHGFSGNPSDLMCQSGNRSEPMDDGPGSDVSPLRSARKKRAFPAEEPLRSKKDKGKAKAFTSELRDRSLYVDDSEKADSSDSDVGIFVPHRAATAQLSRSKGKLAKAQTLTRMSHIEGNTRNTTTSPRKRLRAHSHHTSEEDAPDTDVVPQVQTVPNNRLRTKSIWRVVGPPKSRPRPTQKLAAPSLRPRVWAGSKDELLAALPGLAKNKCGVAWETLEYPTLIFSGERGDRGLGWWDDDAWEGRRIVFSIIRETEVPLADPSDHPSVSGAHDSVPDRGHAVANTQPPPENLSDPPLNDDGALSMVPRSAPWNFKTSASSSGQTDADPPRIRVITPTGTAPSRPIGPGEVPSSGLDHSSILEPELRRDHDSCTDTDGHPATSSMPCGADAIPDGCLSSDRPAAEATRAAGPPSFDTQISLVRSHANGSAPGDVSECDLSEARGAELSCSAPLPARERPIDHSPQAGLVCLSPPESAHLDAISPPCRATLDPRAIPSCAVSDLYGRENLPLPLPPPEVAALLTIHSFGDVVSPVLARNSPLVPWELPSEIGYIWLGLFKITGFKVDTHLRPSTTSKSKALTAQLIWRFSLEWVSGGEEQLKGDGQDDYAHEGPTWPWWEPEHPQQLDQPPLLGPSQSAASPVPESRHDTIMTEQNPRYSRWLLPLPLLAPFTENSTASGNFPEGYYCTVCGRINVQRFLRHRICEGAACGSRTDPQWETGWVITAFSTRNLKVNSATIVPDDKWIPTTTEPATAFADGARLYHYHLALDDSGPSTDPSGAGADPHALSVRHVFNGNRELLQGDASALFETLQRDVLIERSIGASAFATPRIESGDDPALGRNGRSVWDQQAGFIESALSKYCRDLGPLKVRALRVHAWISDGKHVQTFSPRAAHLVLLCLGADLALLSVPSNPNVKSNGKSKKESLRVTMVHGDIVVLSGRQFKFSMVRTGICMLLEAECI